MRSSGVPKGYRDRLTSSKHIVSITMTFRFVHKQTEQNALSNERILRSFIFTFSANEFGNSEYYYYYLFCASGRDAKTPAVRKSIYTRVSCPGKNVRFIYISEKLLTNNNQSSRTRNSIFFSSLRALVQSIPCAHTG